MKAIIRHKVVWMSFAVLALPAAQALDFNYGILDDKLVIFSYAGSGGSVTIPSTIDDRPVTNAASPMVVIEACTNLSSPVWSPVATKTLTGRASDFRDPDWTNYPARFYRFQMP